MKSMRRLFFLLTALYFLSGAAWSEDQPIDWKTIEAQAASGDAQAQFKLGRAYFRGEGMPKDEKKAYEWTKKSAEQDKADAMTNMGFFYTLGIGVEKSEAKALEWFRRGAEKGSATCKLNLGLLLRQGKTIQLSSDESLRLMHEAAVAGSVEAQSYLGQLYFMGDRFLKPDRAKSKPHALKAAEAGDPAAQNIMGLLSRDGIGPLAEGQDQAKAEEWFRKAAEQNEVKAQANLAHFMGVASPGSTNRVEALKWLLMAYDREEPTATKTYNEISPTLPPGMEREARALVGRWHLKQAAKRKAHQQAKAAE